MRGDALSAALFARAWHGDLSLIRSARKGRGFPTVTKLARTKDRHVLPTRATGDWQPRQASRPAHRRTRHADWLTSRVDARGAPATTAPRINIHRARPLRQNYEVFTSVRVYVELSVGNFTKKSWRRSNTVFLVAHQRRKCERWASLHYHVSAATCIFLPPVSEWIQCDHL